MGSTPMHLRYASFLPDPGLSRRVRRELDYGLIFWQTVIKDLRKEAASNKRVSNAPPATAE